MREVKQASDYSDEGNSCLIVGYPGSGKSSGIMTLPGKKFVYVTDPNALQTLKGKKDIDYVDFLPEQIDLDAVTLKKDVRDSYSRAPEPRTYVEFEQDFENRMADNFFDDYDAICFDGSTTLQDICYDRIMYLNGRFGKWPEVADHTAVVNTFAKIMRTATTLRKGDGGKLLLYLTAHVDFIKDDTSGRLINQMGFVGALRRRVPLLLANIWHSYAEPDKDGKTQWHVRTQPDRYNPFLRSAVRGLEPVENVTIDDWDKPQGEGIGGLLNWKEPQTNVTKLKPKPKGK